MRIEALATQGHEAVACLQGARVGVHARDRRGRVAVQGRARQQRMGQAQGHHHRVRCSRDSGRSAAAQGGSGFVDVGERGFEASDLLRGFVALACQQHHVADVGLAQRMGDGGAAVFDHGHLVATRHTGQDLREDEGGRLAARVVAGEHDAVGVAVGGGAHERALDRVAVATAAEHAPQLAATGLGHGAKGLQGFLQRIGRVGVVDHGQGLIGTESGRRRHQLHPAGHRLQRGASLRDGAKLTTQRTRGGDDVQQVRHVEGADHRRLHGDTGQLPRALCAVLDHGEPHTTFGVLHVQRLQAGRARCATHAERPDVQPARLCVAQQVGALVVVEVDDGSAQAGPVEQATLGQPVGSHVAVVVEVVLREVGELGHSDVRGVQAQLFDADGRGFDGRSLQALPHEVAEGAVQGDRVGRRQAGVHHATALDLAHAQRADHAAWQAHGFEHLGCPPRGGRLAVGASHGHHPQRRAGLAVKAMRDLGAAGLQPWHRSNARIVETECLRTIGLDQAGAGTGLQRLLHEGAAVARSTGPGDEGHVPERGHGAAVHRQVGGTLRAQPGQGGCGVGKVVQRGHQKLSTSEGMLVWICDCTSMSGSTPRRCRVCCTTWLNTGAATSPP